MTLQQLRYAVCIARKGSINEAAKSLFISQPSLSSAIRELERELGVTIFLRTNKGIEVSAEGEEFLGYARQLVEQAELIESRYLTDRAPAQHFSVSTQHYAFAVNAFVDLIRAEGADQYDFTLRETRTHEILEDVKNLRSEIGVLYLSEFNHKVLTKLFHEYKLAFAPLFTAQPHIFVSGDNPLAGRERVALEDLEPYPCLSFEQGAYNSFHFSEEILSTRFHRRNIRVSDRATLFNLLIGLNGYTISTGVISADLNGSAIVAVPLQLPEPEVMNVGVVTHAHARLSPLGEKYLAALKQYAMQSI